jgi:hypothetical protein
MAVPGFAMIDVPVAVTDHWEPRRLVDGPAGPPPPSVWGPTGRYRYLTTQ